MEKKGCPDKLAFSIWIAPSQQNPFEWVLPAELYFLCSFNILHSFLTLVSSCPTNLFSFMYKLGKIHGST